MSQTSMNALRICFNHSEDGFSLPPEARKLYGPFGFPEPPEDRPYISANFVQSLGGRISFREIPGKSGGSFISRSPEDHWLVEFLRVHHDAQFIGGSTLREELGPDGRGWDYGALSPEWLAYRRRVLRREKMIVIIVSRSCNISPDHRLFHSPVTETWIATTESGAARVRQAGLSPARIIVPNQGESVDPVELVRFLRRECEIRTLLCEAGPDLYSQFFARRLVDEDFRTIAAQVIGAAAPGEISRPVAYEGPPFLPATAPWLRIVSLHYALPYHVFLRCRYEGPRTFAR